jgi:hypothetical protein
MAETTTPRKQIPRWVSVIVVLLFVAGGAWLVWAYLGGRAWFGQPETFGESDPPSAHMRDAPAMPDGIRQVRPDVWMVRAGGVGMNVRKQRDGTVSLSPYYQSGIDPAQQSVLSARWRLPRDQAMAKAVGATSDQIARLRKLPGAGGGGWGGNGGAIEMEPGDSDQLKKLWSAYASADGAARDQAEAELIAGLTDLGARRMDATKRANDERVAQVQSILTPEQLRKFQATGR